MTRFGRLTSGVLAMPEPATTYEPSQGVVLAVSASGALVVLDEATTASWGPCPWSLGSSGDAAAAIADGFAPRVGDRCLVVFAGSDHVPWVVSWWR